MPYGWYLNIVYMIQRITHPCILSNAGIGIIYMAIIVHDYIFKNGTMLNSAVNIRLFIFCKIDHFGIASSFKIEYGVFSGPAVFIVSN